VAVTDWVDVLASIWEVYDPQGRPIHSYRAYDPISRAYAFPDSISEWPSVLTYPTKVDVMYSAGGPQLLHWQGISEFHIVPSVDKVHYPYIFEFFKLIYKAASSHFQLDQTVASFMVQTTDGGSAIIGPVTLKYGSEEPHLGLVVNWTVKEDIANEITFGA